MCHVSVTTNASLQALHLLNYSLTMGSLGSYLSSFGVTHLLLLWEYRMFDYERYKWKERRMSDLPRRRRRRCALERTLSSEGDDIEWESFPPPAYTPTEMAYYHSLCFDEICDHTPEFLDILTTKFVQPEHDTFCGLLDDGGVGIYMFNEDSDLLVFDSGASVSISNNSKDFVRWDDSISVPTLQVITSTATVQGSGLVRWDLRDDNGVEHTVETKA